MTERLAVLILHGIANHRPADHWQFWLAARLAERGCTALYPDLPNPDAPDRSAWKKALRAQLTSLSQGGGERVVVCHSLACLLWFSAAASLPADIRPDRLLLVSPPASAHVPREGASFRLESFDAQSVRASVRGEIPDCVLGRDPYNPPGAQATYATPLGLDADIVPDAGHITPDDGYGPWPWVESRVTGGRVTTITTGSTSSTGSEFHMPRRPDALRIRRSLRVRSASRPSSVHGSPSPRP